MPHLIFEFMEFMELMEFMEFMYINSKINTDKMLS